MHASAWLLPHTPTDIDGQEVLNRNKASAIQNFTSFNKRQIYITLYTEFS